MSEPVPVDAVPEPVRPLVAAGMAKQPEDRPADAATFVAALNQVAARGLRPGLARTRPVAPGRGGAAAGGPVAVRRTARGPGHHRGTDPPAPALHQRCASRWRSRLGIPARSRRPSRRAIVVAVAGTVLAFRSGRVRRVPHPAALPAVTGVSPASGSTVGGSTVTITGTGLAGATVVRFGGVAGTITADSGTQITVTSPPAPAPRTHRDHARPSPPIQARRSPGRHRRRHRGHHRDHPGRHLKDHRRRPLHLHRRRGPRSPAYPRTAAAPRAGPR